MQASYRREYYMESASAGKGLRLRPAQKAYFSSLMREAGDYSDMDYVTIAFSTFLGAAVALAAERWARWYDAKLKEEAAINNLILDLAARRAFMVRDDWVWTNGEVKRVVDSIFDVRGLIREARLTLRPRSYALPPLREMARACNSFLERAEREDDHALQEALKRLAVDMSTQVRALHAAHPDRVLDDLPGSFALKSS